MTTAYLHELLPHNAASADYGILPPFSVSFICIREKSKSSFTTHCKA